MQCSVSQREDAMKIDRHGINAYIAFPRTTHAGRCPWREKRPPASVPLYLCPLRDKGQLIQPVGCIQGLLRILLLSFSFSVSFRRSHDNSISVVGWKERAVVSITPPAPIAPTNNNGPAIADRRYCRTPVQHTITSPSPTSVHAK